MKRNVCYLIAILGAGLLIIDTALAEVCEGFGPQTPRDITQLAGTNSAVFSFAPESDKLNLCNIHFHKNAEHKGPGFSESAGKDEFGGWQCNESDKLSKSELTAPEVNGCKNIKPGETVEVHWVYSSCDVKPGKGLGSCLSDSCPNPQLRVEAQIFLLVNDKTASNFMDYDYSNKKNGYHQPASIPSGKLAVQFLGSTTGPSFDEKTCSPLQVSWSVRPECMKLDVNTLNKWCQGNKFAEEEAHGVRQIVTDKRLLSTIKATDVKRQQS